MRFIWIFTSFFELQEPFASLASSFPLQGRLHRFLSCFLHSKYLSYRCRRCGGVASAAAAVGVGGGVAAIAIVTIMTG